MARKARKPAKPARRRAVGVKPRYRVAGVRNVWLTFDDGPKPGTTPKVLDVLSAHGITAVFFVIGKQAALHPELVKRIAREGHRIANHTYGHPKLTTLTRAQVKSELQRTERLIGPYMTGRKLFRPPYGAHNAMVDDVSAALGYRTVIWNVDTVDWNRAYQPSKWVQHGINQIRARSDSVVLNHDIWKSTADNLDLFIRRIKALGNVRFRKAAEL
jgi:peptidoglycan/xylan/chitin deacetylase (PgdA/CDA1 family)